MVAETTKQRNREASDTTCRACDEYFFAWTHTSMFECINGKHGGESWCSDGDRITHAHSVR